MKRASSIAQERNSLAKQLREVKAKCDQVQAAAKCEQAPSWEQTVAELRAQLRNAEHDRQVAIAERDTARFALAHPLIRGATIETGCKRVTWRALDPNTVEFSVAPIAQKG